ncbi:glycerate kinase [Desulfovibrio sp. OttesenSCG-928-I05]|nr:glycerate kinase [Desulfovibrio sp. OttesenSCG-928-I05]
MRIVVAPDSFKGSLSAPDAAEAMARGIARVFPEACIERIPIADGGEGTVEALVAGGKGVLRHSRVHDPLGRDVDACWGLVDNGNTAVIEMAAASGLPLLAPEELDPRRASTAGTGELVREALEAGASRIILGIGGSATNDGGAGFAQALGARFLDAKGRAIPPGGAGLRELEHIDLSGLVPRLQEVSIQVACDVDNPLLGPRGASAVYGPQKGADAAMVEELDAHLARFAEIAVRSTGKHDVPHIPGAGAAGGLGAGLLFFTGATLRPGVELVLEVSRFAERARGADLVFTGEGKTDFQTAYGKAPVGVAKAAKAGGVRTVVCLSGGLGEGAEAVLREGIDALASITPGPMSLDDCMRNGAALLEEAAFRSCLLLASGRRLP